MTDSQDGQDREDVEQGADAAYSYQSDTSGALAQRREAGTSHAQTVFAHRPNRFLEHKPLKYGKKFYIGEFFAERIIQSVAILSIAVILAIFYYVFQEASWAFHETESISVTSSSHGDESLQPESYGGEEEELRPQSYGVDTSPGAQTDDGAEGSL